MVTLQVRKIPINYGSAVVPDISTYVGKILPNPKWVSSDFLCLSTDDPQFTFRIIAKSRIVGSAEETIANNSPKPVAKSFAISSSNGSKTYNVDFDGHHWSCDCVGFTFRKHCKHLDKAKELA